MSDTIADGVRLDVWLDVACLFKTRSEAQKACTGGKVEVNGQAGKAHRFVRAGDEVRITRSHGRRQVVVIRELADQHVPKARAREAVRGPDAAADPRGAGDPGGGADLPPHVRLAPGARPRQAGAPGPPAPQGAVNRPDPTS